MASNSGELPFALVHKRREPFFFDAGSASLVWVSFGAKTRVGSFSTPKIREALEGKESPVGTLSSLDISRDSSLDSKYARATGIRSSQSPSSTRALNNASASRQFGQRGISQLAASRYPPPSSRAKAFSPWSSISSSIEPCAKKLAQMAVSSSNVGRSNTVINRLCEVNQIQIAFFERAHFLWLDGAQKLRHNWPLWPTLTPIA